MPYEVHSMSVPEATALVGRLGSGKTSSLVRMVEQTIAAGADPSEVLVLCARTSAVDPLRERLSEHVGPVANTIRIVSARDKEMEILSSHQAQQVLGRSARILNSIEEHVFMQDMKTTSVSEKRLREMVKFFWKSLTELADRDEKWLVSEEERQVFGTMRAYLTFMEEIHPAEISNLAVTYLESSEAALMAELEPHVFVDDYQSLNRASQIFANMIASDSIAICFDTTEDASGEEPYPYAAGLDDFKKMHANAKIVALDSSRLPENVGKMAENALEQAHANERLAQAKEDAKQHVDKEPPKDNDGIESVAIDDDAPAAGGDVVIAGATSPRSEHELIAGQVKSWIDEGVSPDDICIVYLKHAFRSGICSALDRQAIAYQALGEADDLSCDIEGSDGSDAAVAYMGLRLVANHTDESAWRCWCAVGDYLAGSQDVKEILEYAHREQRSFVEAMADIDAAPEIAAHFERILGRYHAGTALIETCSGMCGDDLLKTIAHSCAPEGCDVSRGLSTLRRLANPKGKNLSAKQMAENVDRAMCSPEFERGKVRVCSPDEVVGLDVSRLIVCGCVNGCIPPHECFDLTQALPERQLRLRAKALRQFYYLVGAARKQLVLTYFTNIDLADADRLGLVIDRIRLVKGKRVCRVSPSVFIAGTCNDQAGAA
jgi:DNA helicase-2/ATP-dependent DNA helicase PcrA